MRVLLIKTSSMGDLIHTLPALSDAHHHYPDIQFDWVVEESFRTIPSWHASVANIIPVKLREWRQQFWSKQTHLQLKQLKAELNQRDYDIILDAQGLVKSAWLTFLAKGKRVGLDFFSAREKLAAFAYQKKCQVNFFQHAIVRMRQLFSLALDYPLPIIKPEFGIQFSSREPHQTPYIILLHGTTWTTKQWPEKYWTALADKILNAGYRIKISGGNSEEVARAERIARQNPLVEVIPYLTIQDMVQLITEAKGVVAVDTGFGHLAAALNIPIVSIYGATNPIYTGALGAKSIHLTAHFPCAPCLKRSCRYKGAKLVEPACFGSISPDAVWFQLQKII